jgi:poly(3-hydroxybutyrate) depolymerase
MHMLYDSESFTVTHMLANAAELAATAAVAAAAATPAPTPAMARHGFEIIDKRVGKEVYLDGSWAELFQQQIAAWQARTPSQEEVEHTLEGYAELAQNPVRVH